MTATGIAIVTAIATVIGIPAPTAAILATTTTTGGGSVHAAGIAIASGIATVIPAPGAAARGVGEGAMITATEIDVAGHAVAATIGGATIAVASVISEITRPRGAVESAPTSTPSTRRTTGVR